MADVTELWRDYERGKHYFDTQGYFDRTQECYQMTYGDQWEGVKTGTERPPQLNILLPIMKSATALVGQNLMQIIYHSMNYADNREIYALACDKLNKLAERTWEKTKMDAVSWKCLEDAYISGDAFLYFRAVTNERRLNPLDSAASEVELSAEPIDCTSIMLADEQSGDIQSQPYLLLVQRRYLTDVVSEARRNGVSEDQIALIGPDENTELQLNGQTEVENQLKLTTLIKLWKGEDGIHVVRATKHVIYQQEYVIAGMKRYPIVQYSWAPMKGKARGEGGVHDKIANQLSVNKNLYRFEAAVKAGAFPIKVYNNQALSPSDVKALSIPDTAVGVQDMASAGVDKLISYIQPAAISPYARNIWQDMIALTRNLSGAGDNLENVNPEQASGTAIEAARAAKELNVNAQVAMYKQFIEDIAMVWFALWKAYSPNGLVVVVERDGETRQEILDGETLDSLMVDVKIDVSPTNSFSRAAQDLALKQLAAEGAITFEEFVEALDDGSTFPKKKLQTILEKRKTAGQEQAAMPQALMLQGEEVSGYGMPQAPGNGFAAPGQ